MAYTRFKTAAFGAAKSGLTGVGYQLVDTTGTPVGGRITSGVMALGGGWYGASVAFGETFTGAIRWDTGEATPLVALEEINAAGERLDMAQMVPLTNAAQTLGDALNAARAQGFGAWRLVGTTLALLAPDGLTVVRTFTLDDAANPTVRT